MPRVYTGSEKRRRRALLLRGAKQAFADAVDPRIERQIERLDTAAEERGAREAAALARLLEQAKDDLAAAKAVERTAAREDRATARQARRDAEQQLRRAETAHRRFHR